MNVKLASFLNKNENVPIAVKFKVVSACINSSLTYGCEAWGSTPLNKIEILQRKALKMVLNVSRNAANEVLYVESGFEMLKPAIYKRQLKFFRKMKNDCDNNPASPITAIFNEALRRNATFIRHYKKLDTTFATPDDCYNQLVNDMKEQRRLKFEQSYIEDEDSILGTYKRINPNLSTSTLYKGICCFERDRTIITRYRMGCHKLRIQTGRYGEEESERLGRLCSCEREVQTIDHVLFACSLTERVRQAHNIRNETLDSFFNNEDFIRTASVLRAIEKFIGIV